MDQKAAASVVDVQARASRLLAAAREAVKPDNPESETEASLAEGPPAMTPRKRKADPADDNRDVGGEG